MTKTKYLFFGLGLLLLIALIFFLFGRGSFSGNRVDLKIDGPSEISAGDLVTYKITYKNNNRVALSDVKLNIFYPVDAIVTRDGRILDVATEDFDLGSLGGGISGEKELTAYIVGDKGNIKTIKAALSFRPSTIRSTLQKETTLATTITALAVPITLVATPTIISGQNTAYLIDYRNQSGSDLENLRFKVKYPDGFQAGSFSPKPAGRIQGQDIWDIPKLKQDEGARITIQGALIGGEKEAKTVLVVLQKKITTPDGDVYVDFEKTEATSVISTPPLSLSITLNDSSDYTAHLGDFLRYKISFNNNNGADLTGLNLSVHLEGAMFDFSSVKSDGFFDGRSNTIFWNASTTPALNLLAANQNGAVEFTANLRNNFSGGLGARESFVKISAHAETPNVPANLDLDKLSADSDLVTRISASPTFSQKLLINDPVFGSSGPFPPKVNQKTVFTVGWSLVNPSNDVSQARVTATLSPGVVWENRTRVGGTAVQPSYDSRLNTVTWDIGTLPAGTGVSFPPYETFFQISLTPSVNQVNQSPQLLKNVRFDGVDSFTKEKITRTIPDATTSNISDSNQGGMVQP